MAVNSVQVADQVRELVALLMQRPITEEIALRVATYDTFKHLEIVNGQWTGFEQDMYRSSEAHGWLASKLITALADFVIADERGRVYSRCGFVLEGHPRHLIQTYQPVVSFVRQERLQKTPGYFYGAPDLAVEIVSPSQGRPEFVEKASVYLKYGTTQVWLIFPDKRRIEVHTADTIPTVYDDTDSVPGGELLPGFELTISQLFDE